MSRKPKGKVVSAVGVAIGGGPRSAAMQASILAAAAAALAEGLTDPEEIKARMRAAHQQART